MQPIRKQKYCQKTTNLVIWDSFQADFHKEGYGAMNCPFITGKYMLSCAACQAYVPSIFELDEYCKTSRYTMCPCYIKRDDERSWFSWAAPASFKIGV